MKQSNTIKVVSLEADTPRIIAYDECAYVKIEKGFFISVFDHKMKLTVTVFSQTPEIESLIQLIKQKKILNPRAIIITNMEGGERFENYFSSIGITVESNRKLVKDHAYEIYFYPADYKLKIITIPTKKIVDANKDKAVA